MIGYSISEAQLLADIEAFRSGWLQRASGKTDEARVQGSFAGITSIWSEIKPVFMRLQGGSKCAYCERKLEAEEYGAIEQDVEHFRPKNRVSQWLPSASLVAEGVQLASPAGTGGGYYLLAHQILNYAVGCKPCNSTLKADRFPVAGAYQLAAEDPRKLLKSERPLLLFPVGDWDVDPETAIGFHGLSPQARKASGQLRKRALVTIEFFGLDDLAARKNLFRERAQMIQALFPQLEVLANAGASAVRKASARQVVVAYTAGTAPHASCCRSFKALFDRDAAEAEKIFLASVDWLASIS